MRLSKAFVFDAAHHLPGYQGACRNVHGHTYHGLLTIEGEPFSDGFVMDFKELNLIVRTWVSRLDHQDLNTMMENPTAESIAEWLAFNLKKDLANYNVRTSRGVRFYSVKLFESDD